MNLLRVIYCLFGSRCVPEEAKSTGDSEPLSQPISAKRKRNWRRPARSRWVTRKVATPAKVLSRNPLDGALESRALDDEGTKRTSWIVVKSPTQSVARRTCACASCVDLSRRGVDPTTNNAASNALLEVPTERIPLRPR